MSSSSPPSGVVVFNTNKLTQAALLVPSINPLTAINPNQHSTPLIKLSQRGGVTMVAILVAHLSAFHCRTLPCQPTLRAVVLSGIAPHREIQGDKDSRPIQYCHIIIHDHLCSRIAVANIQIPIVASGADLSIVAHKITVTFLARNVKFSF